MTYRYETESRFVERRGPFGIIKRQKAEIKPVRDIDGCKDLEIISGDGRIFGHVTTDGESIEVKPEGDVFVDMGSRRNIQSSTLIKDKNGEEMVFFWPGGSLRTNGDITIRTQDFRQQVHLRKLSTER